MTFSPASAVYLECVVAAEAEEPVVPRVHYD